MEENYQKLRIDKFIYADSQFDFIKYIVFTRVVYAGENLEVRDIILDPEEHSDFVFISTLEDMGGELIVPYFLINPNKSTKKHLLIKGDVFLISF